MLNNVISALEEQFKKDCTVIDLKYEYEGYIGTERYLIVSHLSEKEILEVYPEQANKYSPFVKVEASFMSVRQAYIQNEDKFRKRARRTQDIFDFDERTAMFHRELICQGFGVAEEDEELSQHKLETEKLLYQALKVLTKRQKKRLYGYFFLQLSTREIAKKEKVSHQAIEQSIEASIKKLRKILKNTLANGYPLSK